MIAQSLNTNHRPVVLVVDDEEMVLRSLEAYLQLETNYHVLTYQSPADALKALDRFPVDLVIADFLMPEMDGLKFLAEVKRRDSEITRILLTGYADKESAIKAINEVGLFQYIEKPWDNEHLKMVIRNGIEYKSLRQQIQEKIRELDRVLLERDALAARDELIRKELELAYQVQQRMLPQELPSGNGFSIHAKYLPALEIGGDFYDILPLADQHIAILLADVTGHGIQAALSTILLKSSFSIFENKTASPDEMLTSMNSILFKVLPEEIFVAALVVILDMKNGQGYLSNAGIPYPYLLRRHVGVVEKIHSRGLLLGIVDEQSYKPGETAPFRLEPGDGFFLFTDGLSESAHEAEKRLDAQFLRPTLEQNLRKDGKTILEELVSASHRASQGGQQKDDVTILAVERDIKSD